LRKAGFETPRMGAVSNRANGVLTILTRSQWRDDGYMTARKKEPPIRARRRWCAEDSDLADLVGLESVFVGKEPQQTS
jgi:hypothetical protein